ncbi:MAG: hypothetical protein GF383_10795 [Candidatus Lokiarchaeota archaeon]|nr:hypothetical protein [Candidatus Lokiarchaeota archaeon]MBD3341092.1 hypothetical protein [Candidatus Lokiarchaeota archaeon]
MKYSPENCLEHLQNNKIIKQKTFNLLKDAEIDEKILKEDICQNLELE